MPVLVMDETPAIYLEEEEVAKLTRERLVYECWRCNQATGQKTFHNADDIPPEAVEKFLRS